LRRTHCPGSCQLAQFPGANKISEIDEHIIVTAAGIISDARVLIERARISAQQHRVTYGGASDTEAIVKDVADIKQQFTQYGGARPFGVSLMIGGYNGKPELYATEVTGNYLKYHAFAIGENDEILKNKLREEYRRDITCDEAVKLALKIFKDLQSEEFSKERFDVGIIGKDKLIVKKTGKDF
jgi:proteasome alpha subunit